MRLWKFCPMAMGTLSVSKKKGGRTKSGGPTGRGDLGTPLAAESSGPQDDTEKGVLLQQQTMRLRPALSRRAPPKRVQAMHPIFDLVAGVVDGKAGHAPKLASQLQAELMIDQAMHMRPATTKRGGGRRRKKQKKRKKGKAKGLRATG